MLTRRSYYQTFFRLMGIGLLIVIPILSLIPLPEMPPQGVGNDKFQHALAYFTLTFCFMQSRKTMARRLFLAAAFIVLGVVIEFLQPSFDRNFDYDDMVANMIGVGLGLLSGTITCRIGSCRPNRR